MVHRGASVQVGDPIYGIETSKTYPGHAPLVMFKTFPSLPGFKAGLRAVKDDRRHATYPGSPTVTWRTFVLPAPAWQPCDGDGVPCP